MPISVQLPVASLAIVPQGESHAAQVSLFFAAHDGRVRKATFPLTLGNAEILDAMGRVADYRLELEMPPGPGKIVVGVRDDFDPRLSVRSVEVLVDKDKAVVLPAGDAKPAIRPVSIDAVSPLPAGPPVDAEATASATEAAADAPLDLELIRGRKVRLPERETAVAYVEVLHRLARGETAGAQAELVRLERVAVPDAVYDQLEKIESNVLRDLERARGAGLLTVALPLRRHGPRLSAARPGAARGARAADELAAGQDRRGRWPESRPARPRRLGIDRGRRHPGAGRPPHRGA